MPSGRTHDRITLWSLPLVAGSTLALTGSSHLTLLISGGFLIGGLMFGPDLDIHSRQYLRWGWLRWIWLPYRKLLRHRSFWSHGPVVGTTIRLLYLGAWVAVLAIGVFLILSYLGHHEQDWQSIVRSGWLSFQTYAIEYVTVFVGLELGSLSHILSDWSGSAYKRWKKEGISGVLRSRKKHQPKRRSPRKNKQSA